MGDGEDAYHEERRNYPVHEDAEADLDPQATLPGEVVQGLVSNFAEDGVHHHKQTDRF